jgi:hypothetical protein
MPACVMLKSLVPILSVAERALVEALAATEKATVPEPTVPCPEVIVTQFAGLDALQAQSAGAFTPTDPVDADAGTDALDADSVGAHVGVNENGFDNALGDVPPGPTAATRAS